MTKKEQNDINVSIFCALKVSEMSKVPVLLMANPGTGKSSTVEMFSEVRGYKLILLRGNSESAETILGYDVAPTDTSKSNSTKHLRPEWFETMLQANEKGEKCLLFLDEITTATEYVQSALLHLIFERKVGTEKIPDSTLIVSAGNYATNLSNSMNILPPLMNRFMIYNIVPTPDDLDKFLCKYKGSILGKRENQMENIKKMMASIDSQELKLEEDFENRAGEFIENSIRTTAKQMMSGSKKLIDVSVTDLQNIYSDVANDSKLPGFVTFRTLNYLRDVTLSMYKCFGKSGITSDNFRNMIVGLVGLGVVRDGSGEVKTNDVTENFFTAMSAVSNEIEKMNNNKLPQYEKFFTSIISGKKEFEISDMNSIINKLKELDNDREIDTIERPVDPTVVEKICDIITKSSNNLSSFHISRETPVLKQIPVEKFNGYASYWSYVADAMTSMNKLIEEPKKNYGKETSDTMKNTINNLRKVAFKLKSVRKMLIMEDPSLGNMIPDIKSF